MDLNELKKTQYLGALATVIAIIALVAVVTTTGNSQDPGSNFPNMGDTEQKVWNNGYRTPLEVVGTVNGDLTATLYTESPKEDGQYGNYVDFSAADATQGMTQGAGFYQVSENGVSTLTFPTNLRIDSGNYQISVTDSSGEYHDVFADVEVPSNISSSDYDNTIPQVIVDQEDFMRKPDFTSDKASVSKEDGSLDWNDREGATDLAATAYSEDPTTFTVERTIEYQHGTSLLGEFKTVSFDGNVSTVDVQVRSEGQSLYDATVIEDGEKTDVDTKLSDNMKTNPEKAKGEVTIEAEVTLDGTKDLTGKTIYEFGLENIYGNNVGTAGTTALVG